MFLERDKDRDKDKDKEKKKAWNNLLKVKGEDSAKWSIRGRKDSKDKSMENKSKPPPCFKSRCSD